ncbi:MAG TPA: S9 family peptidase [Holophagaceae bacterium]|nr:S9 family peptidase [Holophagaceae bacterium]
MRLLRPLAAVVLLAGCALPLAAQALHLPTHRDIFLLKRVGAPAVSPDGHWAAFSVTEPSYDPKEQRSDVWLKDLTSDAPPRPLTFTKPGEGGLAWAPDSRRLAFTAKREGDEQSQVYVLDLAGGEARRVTELPLGARAPKWSPDGTRLLVQSDVFPGAEDPASIQKELKARKERKGTARTYDTFPVRRWDHWTDDRKPSLWTVDLGTGAVANLLAGTKALASRSFHGTQGNDGANLDAVWAPEGRSVVFVAVTNLDQSAHAEVDSHLFQVGAQGGEPVQLTTGHGDHGQPAFSPDGRTLLCVATPNDGKVYHVGRLTAFPWPFANRPTVLTARLDRAISRFVVPTGQDRIYFTFEHAGLERLHSLPLAGGDVREEPGPARGSIGALATGGGRLFGTWDCASQPPEIFAFDAHGATALTRFTADAVAGIGWAPLEHFWTVTKGGRRLHSMLVKPRLLNEGKKVPLFVVIHGGAANMWKDSFSIRWNYDLLTQPNQAVLLTDYRGSSGYGEAFGQSIFLDPLKGPADDVNAAADDALARFPFLDASRQAAGGASYGGHLANWLQATTTRYKAILSHAGEMDLAMQWGTSDGIYHRELTNGGPVWDRGKVWSDQSPLMQGGNAAKGTGFKTPILITVGELDYRVPANNALMNFALQQRLQVPSRLVVFPDENHWILKGENHLQWYEEVKAWLAKYL